MILTETQLRNAAFSARSLTDIILTPLFNLIHRVYMICLFLIALKIRIWLSGYITYLLPLAIRFISIGLMTAH